MAKVVRSLSRYDREMGRTLAEIDVPPSVIDINMIREEVVKTAPKGLVGSTFKAFYKIESIDRLSLERLNILQIDNLWMLKKITKLSLANNVISKIENLDSLVTLVDLNLSFNNITVIENLSNLVNLERLSLYHNKIREVKNLDLEKLTILSLGANLIQDKECVLYLRRMKNLRSLNLEENPCAGEENFRQYVASLLPQVVYFGYNLISSKERSIGKKTFEKELKDLIMEEKEAEAEAKVEVERQKRKEFLALSYVDRLEGEEMFDALFKDDPDGLTLMTLQGKLVDIFDSLKEDIVKLSMELFKLGQKEYKRRCEEHDDFVTMFQAAKETGIQQSRSLLKEFEDFQSCCVSYLDSLTSNFDKRRNKGIRMVKLSRLRSFYDEYYQRYWLALNGREIFLHDQLEDLIAQFEARMGEQVSDFIEKSMHYFTLMRDAEMNYFESLSDRTLKFLAQITAKEGMNVASFLSPSVLQILRDKESVNNSVGTSHDVHLLVIDTTEDYMVTSINNWFKELVRQYSQNEIERNRKSVLELINYMEGQNSDFVKTYKANYKACKELYRFVKKSLKARVRNFAPAEDLMEHRQTLAISDERGARHSELATLLGAKIQSQILPKPKPKKKVVIVVPEKDEKLAKMDEEVELFLSAGYSDEIPVEESELETDAQAEDGIINFQKEDSVDQIIDQSDFSVEDTDHQPDTSATDEVN